MNGVYSKEIARTVVKGYDWWIIESGEKLSDGTCFGREFSVYCKPVYQTRSYCGSACYKRLGNLLRAFDDIFTKDMIHA